MKMLTAFRVAAVALTVFAAQAHAQDTSTCQAAAAACDLAAAEKKLAGAAKTSFTRKCVRDAVGEAPAAADKKP